MKDEQRKDKLASSLKERLSHSHREKQLMIERKKKAAMFLTMLKTEVDGGSKSSFRDDNAGQSLLFSFSN